MTKRVCFIRQSVYPYELSHRREVETVHRAGYETHVICLSAEGAAHGQTEEAIDGVQVHRLPLERKKTGLSRYLMDYLAFSLMAALTLTRLHLRHPFHAIQVNTMPDFLVFATLLPKLLGAKVALVMHEPVPELWQTLRGKPAPAVLALAEQAALAYADAAFTVTEQLKQRYVARGARADKIQVILNVPDSRFLSLNGQAQPSPPLHDAKTFTLICHGAIEERYGHGTLLHAMQRVRAEWPGVQLRILGQGSFVAEFLKRKTQEGLDDCVHYLGFVPLEQMVRELHSADAGLVAQESSAYSNLVHTNKMYDYLAVGKPVIASRLESVRAYFGEEDLCYFEPGNPDDLARAILEVARSPEKRQALVHHSQQTYARVQWDLQRETYLAVYRQWLS